MTIGINQAPAALASVPVGSGKAGAKNQGDGNTFGSVVALPNPGAKGKGGDMSSTPTIGFQKPEKLGQQKTPVNSEQEAPRWLRPGAQFDTAIDSEFALKVAAEQADAGEEPQLDEVARAASANGGKETVAAVANFRLPGQVSGETISVGRIDTKNGAKSAAAELTRSLSQTTGVGDAVAEGAEPATSSISDDFRQSLEAGSRGRQQGDASGRHADGKAERVTVVAQQNIPAPIAQSPVSTASTLATQIASDAGWREAAAPSFRPLERFIA